MPRRLGIYLYALLCALKQKTPQRRGFSNIEMITQLRYLRIYGLKDLSVRIELYHLLLRR